MINVYKHLGYYSAGGHLYRHDAVNKIEAVELAKHYNGWVQYHFNDEVYSSYNWQIEPIESVSDLYRTRALALREKYDYLIIMYSGGFDSHNLLMSFLDNNIPVDEICYVYHGNRDVDSNSYFNEEWRVQTLPKIQKLQLTYTLTVRKLDISQLSLDLFTQFYKDWTYVSSSLAPNVATIGNLTRLVPDWINLQEKGNTLAMVTGIDKPRLRYHNNNFIFNFYDLAGVSRPTLPGCNLEWFYWSPDAPKLVIKQCHIAKKFWSAHVNQFNIFPNNKLNKDLGWVLDPELSTVQRLIYPYCDIGNFYTRRPNNLLSGSDGRDHWIYSSNTDYAKKLTNIIGSLNQNISTEYRNHPTNIEQGLIGTLSQDYILN